MTAPALRLTGTARIGGRVLFGPLDLAVPGGGWCCLLGPSGAGKSSLLHLLAGTSGAVTLDGSARAGDGAPLAGRVALMAQTDLLLPWLDLCDNIRIGARLRGTRPSRAQAEALLDRLGLAGMGARKPGALSGGQRQRVALARTLLEDRPVVLLDEPFSALDVATRLAVQDMAAHALRGRTVLHVTHDPAEAARLGDSILLLAGGQIRAVDPPPDAPPRAPDATATLSATGRLTRLLLEAA